MLKSSATLLYSTRKEAKSGVLTGITLSCCVVCAADGEAADQRGKRDSPFTGDCFVVIIGGFNVRHDACHN